MQSSTPERDWLLHSLRRYWPRDTSPVAALPVASAPVAPERLPPSLVAVRLPDWAADVGVDGSLLVPRPLVMGGDGEPWTRTDWWQAAFWYLHCAAERQFERERGPIHSYSPWLTGFDPRQWERAWVNRIALFLRRWAEQIAGAVGPLPDAEVHLTHDVDAVAKTPAIRFKQTVFHLINALRRLAAGQPRAALSKVRDAIRFLLSSDDYDCIDRLLEMEMRVSRRSHFFLYGGRAQSLKQRLFDPAYRVADLAALLRRLDVGGWSVGLHQSFEAWRRCDAMTVEKQRVDAALGRPIDSCRQHWLRFSFGDTWQAQQEAGFRLDATLGFNDRSSFRNGAALRFHPWHEASRTAMELESIPLVLMDSHLYDYSHPDAPPPRLAMLPWLREIHEVRGQASVLWHPHTLSRDYGWADGYEALLELLAELDPAAQATGGRA